MLFSIVLRFGNTWFLLCLELRWCNMTKCIHKILAGGVNYIKSNLHKSKISFNTGVT